MCLLDRDQSTRRFAGWGMRELLSLVSFISALCVIKFKGKVAPFFPSASGVVLAELCVQLSATECFAARFVSR